ncbi:MAG: hypothetical protein BWY06_02859 [Candidatus Latescibacteria bacterium ADurb.Bin168]|nr:MAG: hypothetical protein BWY06_02859 [Candidatus Latescibacteria bacterium ADurb.Bin168]
MSHRLRGFECLLRDGQIAGAGAYNQNLSPRGGWLIRLPKSYRPRGGVVPRLRNCCAQCLPLRGGYTSSQKIRPVRDNPVRDNHNLFHSLGFAENDLGESLSQRSVVVQLCETEVFEWESPEGFHGFFGAQGTVSHLFKEGSDTVRCHVSYSVEVVKGPCVLHV